MSENNKIGDPKKIKKKCRTIGCENMISVKEKFCGNCLWKAAYVKKKRIFDKWNNKKDGRGHRLKAINKAEQGHETAEKLWKKALALWSSIIRGTNEFTFCHTCGKPLKTKDGLRGAHAGHYLDKANHWKLSLETNNGLPQGRCCNVDYIHNPKKIEVMKIELRSALVAKHGRDSIDLLDKTGEEFRNKVKRGLENSKPRTHDPLAAALGRESDIDFLKRKIIELTQIKKDHENSNK